MTETDIECGHTKTTLHARGVNRSRKIITFSHLNSTNVYHSFMREKVKSKLAVLNGRIGCFSIIFTLGSVVKLLFDDFFHIAFHYTISL